MREVIKRNKCNERSLITPIIKINKNGIPYRVGLET